MTTTYMAPGSLRIRPDIGGTIHVIMTPENPLRANFWPAPMIDNADGRPCHVDYHTARREHPNCTLVSYRRADHSITCMPLANTMGWYTPTILHGRLIEYVLQRALVIPPKNDGIDLCPPKRKNLEGQRIGAWLIGRPVVQSRQSFWSCTCDCGTVRLVQTSKLLNGSSQSCGCSKAKHGLARKGNHHPVYDTWAAMLARCTNPSHPSWKDYGGRGITVCEAWHSADGFIRDMLPTWKRGLTLERTDNNGNYSKDNCIWTTQHNQSRNKRRNVIVPTPDGNLPLIDAVNLFGVVAYSTAQTRVYKGMDPWLAITTPAMSRSEVSRFSHLNRKSPRP